MKISLIQMNSISDKAANIAAAAILIEQAVTEERPDWISLPECFDFLGGEREAKVAAAETFPGGPAYAAMQTLAKKHQVYIHAGSILEKPKTGERIHNTTVAFDRAGREIARYRKIHMFDITAPDGTKYNESAVFAPGDASVTYRCEDIIVGCAICYDLRFPDLFQALVAKGAQMIALPAAFTLQTGKDHWEVLCRARAIETEAYVCAPAQTGAHVVGTKRRHTYGHSLAVDPWGHVIAKASDGIGIVAARIDLDRVNKIRAQIPVGQHKVRFD
ncbi:MAG: carbon-nitrogen hydrolase family protein [Methylocella sp.]